MSGRRSRAVLAEPKALDLRTANHLNRALIVPLTEALPAQLLAPLIVPLAADRVPISALVRGPENQRAVVSVETAGDHPRERAGPSPLGPKAVQARNRAFLPAAKAHRRSAARPDHPPEAAQDLLPAAFRGPVDPGHPQKDQCARGFRIAEPEAVARAQAAGDPAARHERAAMARRGRTASKASRAASPAAVLAARGRSIFGGDRNGLPPAMKMGFSHPRPDWVGDHLLLPEIDLAHL